MADLGDFLDDEDFWDALRKKLIKNNLALWQTVWQTGGQAAYRLGARRVAKELGISWEDVPFREQEYYISHGRTLCEQLTDTDLGQIRDLIEKNWGKGEKAFARDAEASGLASPARLKLIYRNEIHESNEYAGLHQALDAEVETHSWMTMGDERACHICLEYEAENQNVPIQEPFSNGEMIAKGHAVGCRCRTLYNYTSPFVNSIKHNANDCHDEDGKFCSGGSSNIRIAKSTHLEGIPKEVSNAFEQEFSKAQKEYGLKKLEKFDGVVGLRVDPMNTLAITTHENGDFPEVHISKEYFDNLEKQGVTIQDDITKMNHDGLFASKNINDVAYHEVMHQYYYEKLGYTGREILSKSFKEAVNTGIVSKISKRAAVSEKEFFSEFKVKMRQIENINSIANKQTIKLYKELDSITRPGAVK
jgi:hypothetical protein